MTFDFDAALRDYGVRASSTADPMDPFLNSYSDTHRALRQIINPLPASSWFSGSGGYASTAGRVSSGGGRGWAQPEQDMPVPGPLGIWEEDKGRPHQQGGKFGFSLLGSQGTAQPGAPSPYTQFEDPSERLRALAAPDNPENRGFFEGLIGGIGGIFGEAGQDVGSFVGSGLDLPFETAGNVVGLPGAITSALPYWMDWRDDGLDIDTDLKALWEEAAEDNPINGLLLWGHVAKAQFQRDVQAGRINGLSQDIGPATALTDQLGLAVQVAFGMPMRGVQRLIAGTGGSDEAIQQVTAAMRRGEDITNPAWQRMADRLNRGDFGPVGSEQARNNLLDALVVEGSLLRDPDDPEQEGLLTGQGLTDFVFSMVTDPWILASFGIGAASRVAKGAATAANGKFWTAVPEVARLRVMEEAEKAAMRIGNYADPERAWMAMANTRGANAGFQNRVLREVVQNPEFAPFRQQAEDALGYVERYRTTWEPALRPITELVRTVNDPFRLLGRGPAGAKMDSVFSAHATEGLIRGQGSLDAHVQLQNMLSEVPGDFLANYERGLGVYTANFARTFFRNGLIRDLRRKARNGDDAIIPFAHAPDDVIRARMGGARGRDIATGVEQMALRFRPLYLATEAGGGEAALARAREEAAGRLQLMGMTRDQATGLTAQMNRDHISLLDGAYFGWATDSFVNARTNAMSKAIPKGGLDPEALTILGPRQMTVQVAEGVLDSITRGAVDEVREALRRYDILFDNFSEGLDDADLLKAVRELLQDQIDAESLPRDLNSLNGLDDGLRQWATDNAPLGYRVGFRPTGADAWRVTANADGQIVGINPWTELAGTAADVPTYSRWQLARDTVFHNIRGERIMADARVRLAQFMSEHWGATRADADALFARFLRTAQESGITPRGMSPEQIYHLVKTQKMGGEIVERIGVHNAVEALNHAFEGNWRKVGLTQKFTGRAKTSLGGQGNWIGQVAERIYPSVRFTLNPLFQAQELVEPFILNVMRGIKPGFKPSDMDVRTLALIESMIRDSKYAFDDQIERTAVLLWGADSARDAFRPGTPLGKVVRAMSIGGRINVREVKRVNFARATRRQLGREFEESMARVAPDLHAKLPAMYASQDWGEIAVKFLTEKAQLETPSHVLKASHLGARTPVDLTQVVALFDQIDSVGALRQAVRSGDLDATDFKDVLVEAGADPDFAARALSTAAAPFDPEEWWAEWRTVFRAGNQRATDADRKLLRQLADFAGMSEEEYLARRMADTPMSADSRALAALPQGEKRHLQLMAEVDDMAAGRPQPVDETLATFRRTHRHADRESFVIIDDDGSILEEGSQIDAWHIHPGGQHTHAQLGEELEPFLPRATGKTLVHNHPSHNPFSPADIGTAAQFGVREMIVESPAVTYSLKPNPVEGWLTPEFEGVFGEAPEGMLQDTASSDLYWMQARPILDAMWRTDSAQVIAAMKDTPFYAHGDGEMYEAFMDSVAINTAVQKMADRFGWTFTAKTHPLLPADPAARHRAMADMAMHPPEHLRMQYPYAYTSQFAERVDARAGTSVSFEYASRHRPWMPEGLSEDQQRAIMDGWEEWARAKVAPLFGNMVTDVRRARGGWMSEEGFTDTVNSVIDVFGPEPEDLAATIGFLLKQDAVVTSRPKIGRHVADPDAGERWALHFVADDLTDEQATALAQAVGRGAPGIAEWGSSVVRTTDGRTAVRFVAWDQSAPMDRATFVQSEVTNQATGARLNQELDALGISEVEVYPDVVDFRYISNDWDEAQPHGEGYLEGLRERRPDVVGRLEHGLASESEAQLAHLVRGVAPAEFDTHLAILRSRGEPIPDFRVPGEFDPAPLADRVTVSLPGGRASLFDGERTFSLWEQQIIKANRINAVDLYNADPDLYVGMMDAIWRGKRKTLEGAEDTRLAYNAFAFAALTSNAALDVTEGSFALLRARSETGSMPVIRGLRGMHIRGRRIANMLPERYRRDPSALGTMFQMDEGLRVSGLQLRRANWLNAEQRTEVDRLAARIDRRLRNMTDEQRERWVPRIQARLDGTARSGRQRGQRTRFPGFNGNGVQVQVHPFPVEKVPNGYADGRDLVSYISISRPNVRYKGTNTNTSWGNVLRWLNEGIFLPEGEGMRRFLRVQPGESRSNYALRMSSILPGIDVKTAMMAMQSAGPEAVAHGALDTHIIRWTVQKAAQRGELDDLLGRLSPGYASHLREEVGRSAVDKSTAFKSPTGQRIRLRPDNWNGREWSPEVERRMRENLHLIPDPEMRAMYDDAEVLRLVHEGRGFVNVWGGDYAVIEEYFGSVLKAAEADDLRAAGHVRAAERVAGMSGGEWQWFKWDHIRGAAGTPLDPHVGVSRGADLVGPRTGAELDRAIQIQRMGSPYDPQMAMLWQQIDGRILGANQIMDDGRRVLLATQHADARTGLHELAHVFEQELDPSLRVQVIAAFREATGSRRTTWSREVSEWWADSFLDYVKGGSRRVPNRSLRSSFEYFRKTVTGVEATIKAQAAERTLTRSRSSAITRATKAVERTAAPARDAGRVSAAADRTLAARQRELRRARSRTGIAVLEQRAAASRDDVIRLDQDLRDARAAVRAARGEVRTAETRAREALGTRSAGGAAAAVGAKRRAVATAEARVASAEKVLTKAKAASTKATRSLNGARKRTPLKSYEDARDAAKAAADKARAAAAKAKGQHDDATKALRDAKALPTRPVRTRIAAAPISPAMQDVFDAILTPPPEAVKYGPGSPIDAGQRFNIEEEAAYEAAQLALSRAEENAFTLHYYKRGRSFLERSINHPYFGLYPASYMWGKVLPELIRFLTRTPFGLDAPMGGLALANNIYRQTMMQQAYDDDFRQEMVERTDLFHLLALLTPGLPWEIPVNAPLWTRRLSENSLTYEDKLRELQAQYGDMPIPDEEMPPLMGADEAGKMGREMFNYAFGPAYAIEQVGVGIGAGIRAVDEGLQAAQQTVESVLRGAEPLAPSTEPAAELPQVLPGGAIVPASDVGY